MTVITAAMVRELRDRTSAGMMACKKALTDCDGNMEAAIEELRKRGEAQAAKRAGKTAAQGMIVVASSQDSKKALIIEVNCETDFVARSDDFSSFAQQIVTRGLSANITDLDALLALSYDENGEISIAKTREMLVSKLGENIHIRRLALLESKGLVTSYCHGSRIGVLVSLDQEKLELAKDLAMHVAANNPSAIHPEDIPEDIIAKEREIFLAQGLESGKPAAIVEKMVAGRVEKFVKETSLLGQAFVKDTSITVNELLQQEQTKVLAFVRYEVGEGIEVEVQNFADEVMAQIKDSKD